MASTPEMMPETLRNDYYVLSSDYQGTTRLALQQYVWQQALGYNIHPRIPQLPETAKIADVAAGTGLWLIEVGRQLPPTVSLNAFDITLRQAPPKPWLPENMDLHNWNIFDEPPSQFQGIFDLVHVRLVTVVIKEHDPTTVMRNLGKLLKAGGWLQWDEVDVAGSFVERAYPNLSTPAMDAWCDFMATPKYDKKSVESIWKTSATTMLNNNGFEESTRHDVVDSFKNRMELMRYNSDQLMMLAEQYARRVYASSHDTAEKILQMLSAASKDAENGAALIMPPLIWTARKA